MDVVPLPQDTSWLADARDGERALRVSWHHEVGCVVLSTWRDGRCVGTVRLDPAAAARLVGSSPTSSPRRPGRSAGLSADRRRDYPATTWGGWSQRTVEQTGSGMDEQDAVGGSTHESGAPAATGGPGSASAGTPGGRIASGATPVGVPAQDEVTTEGTPAQADATSAAPVGRPVPGREPAAAVPPVPTPGDVPGAAVPAVQTAAAPSPRDGIVAGEKSEGSDAGVVSAGAYVALAAPGHPDGEVDTRAR